MNYKKILLKFFIISLILSSVIISINYIVDPNFLFKHKNYFNEYQVPFNERIQKSNYLNAHKNESFKNIILGSSRVTYMSQYDFSYKNSFNFASSAMRPEEYDTYINKFKNILGYSAKKIIIGVDFFSTNSNYDNDRKEENLPKIFGYKYIIKNIINIDTLKRSFNNVFLRYKYHDIYNHYYTRNNIKVMLKYKNIEKLKNKLNYEKKHYLENIYGKNYKFDDSLELIFEKLKASNPNSNFIIFTTPVSLPIFKIAMTKRKEEYKKWLKMLVRVFGNINNLMINSEFINDYEENFADGSHAYPNKVKKLILSLEKNNTNNDLLNIDNIDEYLQKELFLRNHTIEEHKTNVIQ